MNWSAITGISSAVIALCALVFSIWQGKQTQKHNKLSFLPHLTTWTQSDPEKGLYTAELMNNGTGPAVIESYSIMVDGKRMPGDRDQIENALKIILPQPLYPSYTARHSYLGKDASLSPKERFTIVSIQFHDPFQKEFVEKALDRADLEISYKSFYEEKFHFSSREEKSSKRP
ncbi:MAG: hypothetical protein P8Y39_07305 [Nitrospirota bacterium]